MVPLIVVAVAIVMIICEVRRPGRSFPQVSGWWLRAVLLNGLQAGVVIAAGILWEPWMQANRVVDASGMGVTLGAAFGYVVVTFIYYWWHRARHEVPFLWRWIHQIHHSPQRLEIITSFYKHPIEVGLNGLLSSAVFYLLCGLSVEAATYADLLTGLAELFYHWNVRTPYWVGYLIQRPESHCVHHEQGLHAYNYGDLPLWDMMFGTFKNPRVFEAKCGFVDERELALSSMLLGVDVNAPPTHEEIAEVV